MAVRLRSMSFALLGAGALFGLLLVAILAQPGSSLLPALPIPGLGSGGEQVSNATPVARRAHQSAASHAPAISATSPVAASAPGRHRSVTAAQLGPTHPSSAHGASAPPAEGTPVAAKPGPVASEPAPAPAPAPEPASSTTVAVVPAPTQAGASSPASHPTTAGAGAGESGNGNGHSSGHGGGHAEGHGNGRDSVSVQPSHGHHGGKPATAPRPSSAPEAMPGTEQPDAPVEAPHGSSDSHGHGHDDGNGSGHGKPGR